MTKKQHYMTKEERYKLEGLLEAGASKSEAAKILGFSRQTIYNEIQRGTYMHTVKWYDDRVGNRCDPSTEIRKDFANAGKQRRHGYTTFQKILYPRH